MCNNGTVVSTLHTVNCWVFLCLVCMLVWFNCWGINTQPVYTCYCASVTHFFILKKKTTFKLFIPLASGILWSTLGFETVQKDSDWTPYICELCRREGSAVMHDCLVTSRVCGRGNVFVMCVCVCVCLSVCLCVCSGYNFWTIWHRNFIFGVMVHLDNI